MFEAPNKPFLDTLGEDVRINPNEGVLSNIGENVSRAGDKMLLRDQYRRRAAQMNQALDDWQHNQAMLRHQVTPVQDHPMPSLWPRYPNQE